MFLFVQVRHAASQLAIFSQAVVEEEEFLAVGQENMDSGRLGCWNGNVLQSVCTTSGCGVRFVRQQSSGIQKVEKTSVQNTQLQLCVDCGRPACSACIAGQSSYFLARSIMGVVPKERAALCKRYLALFCCLNHFPTCHIYFYFSNLSMLKRQIWHSYFCCVVNIASVRERLFACDSRSVIPYWFLATFWLNDQCMYRTIDPHESTHPCLTCLSDILVIQV